MVLHLKDISKRFPGVQALDKVTLSIEEGEVHCILGQNGAGKSTLIKILAGAHQADEGEILYKGHKVLIPNPHAALEMGISVIYQELDLVPYLSAIENIFLGRFPTRGGGIINWGKARNDTKNILEKLGCTLNPNIPVNELSPGEQQMVAIAKAVSYNASVIVMDEPTSSLSEREQQRLFKIIGDLKKQNTTIIYITHKFEEVFLLGDRATVLRDGRLIGTWKVKEITQDFLVEQMIGHPVSRSSLSSNLSKHDELLRVEGISTSKLLKNVSFCIRRGEVVGLAGLVGSGRTELLRLLFGADPIEQGKIFLEGKPFVPQNPRVAKQYGVGLVPEDRKTQGLVLSLSVFENMILTSLHKFQRAGVMKRREALSVAYSQAQRLRGKIPSMFAEVSTLSGGNQQKVVLSKWLISGAKVLLLDEPTRGIDVGAKEEIYQIIRELSREGIGIIMVSSEFPDLLAVCDRILVMRSGRLVGEFDPKIATKEEIMECAIVGDIQFVPEPTL